MLHLTLLFVLIRLCVVMLNLSPHLTVQDQDLQGSDSAGTFIDTVETINNIVNT